MKHGDRLNAAPMFPRGRPRKLRYEAQIIPGKTEPSSSSITLQVWIYCICGIAICKAIGNVGRSWGFLKKVRRLFTAAMERLLGVHVHRYRPEITDSMVLINNTCSNRAPQTCSCMFVLSGWNIITAV